MAVLQRNYDRRLAQVGEAYRRASQERGGCDRSWALGALFSRGVAIAPYQIVGLDTRPLEAICLTARCTRTHARATCFAWLTGRAPVSVDVRQPALGVRVHLRIVWAGPPGDADVRRRRTAELLRST